MKSVFFYFYFPLQLSVCKVLMALREQVKSDIFESRVDEGMLEWFRRRFCIPSEYSFYVTDKKAHESYTDEVRLVVYQD